MEDRNIRLLIQYDGGHYDGFAKVAGKNKLETIQDKLEAVLSKMTGETIEIIGAEKTQAGEHAYEQVANFHSNTNMKCWEIKHYLNRYLPRDIAVDRVDDVPDRFHSMFAAVSKTYVYRVGIGEVPCVFDRKYSYYCFDKLNTADMKKAAAYLIGRHDFKSFSDVRRMSKSSEREIFSIDIYADSKEIQFTIQADGYLNHMVRIIVGTLIEVGKGERKPESMKRILEGKNRELAGQTLPAQGLFLQEIEY